MPYTRITMPVRRTRAAGWNLAHESEGVFYVCEKTFMSDYDFGVDYGTPEYAGKMGLLSQALEMHCDEKWDERYWLYASPHGAHVFHMHVVRGYESTFQIPPVPGSDSVYYDRCWATDQTSVRLTSKAGSGTLLHRFVKDIGHGEVREEVRTDVLRIGRVINALNRRAVYGRYCHKHQSTESVWDNGVLRCGACAEHRAQSQRLVTEPSALVRPAGFGIELEIANFRLDCAPSDWSLRSDSSVTGTRPVEVASPVLTVEDLPRVEFFADMLRTSEVNDSCGFHVHHDVSDLTVGDVRRMVASWRVMEKYLGEHYAHHRTESYYCRPLADVEIKRHDRKEQIVAKVSKNRYHSLNLQAIAAHGTVEFRSHAGTVDPKQIVNWVKMTQAVVRSAEEVTDAESFLEGLGLREFYAKEHRPEPKVSVASSASREMREPSAHRFPTPLPVRRPCQVMVDTQIFTMVFSDACAERRGQICEVVDGYVATFRLANSIMEIFGPEAILYVADEDGDAVSGPWSVCRRCRMDDLYCGHNPLHVRPNDDDMDDPFADN